MPVGSLRAVVLNVTDLPVAERFWSEVIGLPVIDWAVMSDPFGNEFCLVSELSEEESRAVEALGSAATDAEWRAAAGRTS